MSDVIADVAAPLAEGTKELVDRLTPDVNARAAAIMGAEKDALDATIRTAEAQTDINKVEAANPSKFVAGWRPGLGWLCVVLLGLYYAPQFLLSAVMQAVMFWQSCHTSCAMPAKPGLDISEIMGLVTSLLGMGSLRTLDKFLGVDTKSVGQVQKGIRTVVAKVSAAARPAAKALLPIALATGLWSCAGEIPPASILPQAPAPAAALPEIVVPFSCPGLELSIDVVGQDSADHLKAYLAKPTDAAAADFLNWTAKNAPDGLEGARQVVTLVSQTCGVPTASLPLVLVHGDADWIREGGFHAPSNGVFCCGVADCRRIPKELVRVVRRGYALKIADQQIVVPFDQALPSDDDEFWGCGPNGDLRLIRCFFAPPVGT